MKHLSTLHLHQLRYGELPADREPEVKRHIAECEKCANRLALQERERRAFEVHPVPSALRPAAPARSRWWSWGLVGALAAAAAALTVAAVDPTIFPIDDPALGVRPKGDTSDGLEVWVERDGGARPWREGELLRAGDRVQLVIAPDGARTLTVGGRDGTGGIEVYGSFDPVDRNRPAPAPFALTLDDALGPQEFFALRGDRAFTDAEVKDAVARDVHPPGVTVVRVALPKE